LDIFAFRLLQARPLALTYYLVPLWTRIMGTNMLTQLGSGLFQELTRLQGL
jgi:hypothetical protein